MYLSFIFGFLLISFYISFNLSSHFPIFCHFLFISYFSRIFFLFTLPFFLNAWQWPTLAEILVQRPICSNQVLRDANAAGNTRLRLRSAVFRRKTCIGCVPNPECFTDTSSVPGFELQSLSLCTRNMKPVQTFCVSFIPLRELQNALW